LADEAYKQRWAATQEKVLADKAYEQRPAATREKALADEVNKQRCQVTTALEKALANEAYERRLAATREKALADEVNKQHCKVTAARENALANDAYERHYQELANVSPPPHRPTMYKDAVLSTMGGSLRTKSLVVAPLSRLSTTVDNQLQTACCRSQLRCHVGCRHGSRAPNPQEHLLCRRQHRPHAPNQSTVNGWA
jgi:hypothetical protein